MITEIATITIDPSRAEAFEAAVAKALPLFRAAEGWRGMTLEREVENPSHYYLIAQWDNVEDHTVKFRGSEAFRGWRALVGDFFVTPPAVVHSRVAARFS
ncbi:MAG: antibiotic biosynthesis monooxygenase family protein [Gammaproteobacteria bacterium]